MKRTAFSWWRFITFLMFASIIGVIGLHFPLSINAINNIDPNSLYGTFASHASLAIIFWLLMKDWKFFVTTDKKKVNWKLICNRILHGLGRREK